VRLGDVEQWRVSIRRSDGQHEPQQHPFHIHINHFQILNASHGLGYDYEIGDWRDTITYPAANPPEFT
jgi:FtsP/CotA-like multicopper oxidase with cupredoxin domain